MTIAELAGPVLLRVLPGAAAVLLVVAAIVLLPVVVPRAMCWLNGPDHLRCAHRRRAEAAFHAYGTGHGHGHGSASGAGTHRHAPHSHAPASRTAAHHDPRPDLVLDQR